jgi:hypothetical protein
MNATSTLPILFTPVVSVANEADKERGESRIRGGEREKERDSLGLLLFPQH